ncbi:alpha/beta hydrolase family protein [Lentisphaera profundi]|uniref:Alpha/beta hydrolase family protein n=1 Tax=Lentisphaera profundi TaxID=1658616 RepID=A0ABY7VWE4_9BACT|nr:alpha/beta hydrolase family protein [Lentisphaera profundi]WDE98047.1 alpha/beta hydrolase family protein [Lentisphaera profundi]
MMSKMFFSLFVIIYGLQSAEVKTLEIFSEKMKKHIPASIILPDEYMKGDKSFPVLYLLHGAGGNHMDWRNITSIATLADQYGMIVLCPDGAVTSWYFDSPIDPKFQYETHVAKECVTYLDKNYRTKADRKSRAISGLSMGGHGAMYLALRHPQTFSIAVPLSGGVDIRPFPNNWDIKKRLGEMSSNKKRWDDHTVIELAKNLKDGDLALSIDCGTEDFFLKVNRNLHTLLKSKGVKHNYEEHPGAHNWDYWKAAIIRQMPFISKEFKKADKE